MLSKAKRTPVKHSSALRAICESHKVTIDDANLMVCQGRKVVYVLRIGTIHSKNCFAKEPPTPSYRKESGVTESGWKTIAIPNGWKVALIVDNEVWTAEVSYDHNDRDIAQYRFALIGESGEEFKHSDWCYTPSAAFKSASCANDGADDQAWGRHNGKLYLGCTYDYPQTFLRNHFSKIIKEKGTASWDEGLQKAIVDWLDPSKQTDSPTNLQRSASHSKLDEARQKCSRMSPDKDQERKDIHTKLETTGNLKRKWEQEIPTMFNALGQFANKRSCSADTILSFPQNPGFSGTLNSETNGIQTSFPSLDAQSHRLDIVNALFCGQIWQDVEAADPQQKMNRFRSMLPAVPPTLNVISHVRAMTSGPGTPLNEEEVHALLQHIDIQVSKVAAQKALGMTASMGLMSSPGAGGGVFSTGAIKRTMTLVSTRCNKIAHGSMAYVTVDELADCLELIEVGTEHMYPLLMRTLFMMPMEDVFRQALATSTSKGRFSANDLKLAILFVQDRLMELKWTTFQAFSLVSNVQGFISVIMSFLPRAHLVRRFVHCLHSMSIPQQPAPSFSSGFGMNLPSMLPSLLWSRSNSAPGTCTATTPLNGLSSPTSVFSNFSRLIVPPASGPFNWNLASPSSANGSCDSPASPPLRAMLGVTSTSNPFNNLHQLTAAMDVKERIGGN